MQKNLVARLSLKDKKYFLALKVKTLDGRIFLTGKVDDPEEKFKLLNLLGKQKVLGQLKMILKLKKILILNNQQKIY